MTLISKDALMKKILFIISLLLVAFYSSSFAMYGANLSSQNQTYKINYTEDEGLILSCNNGDFMLNISGYLEADFLKFTNDDGLLHSGTNIRYAVLYLNPIIYHDWRAFIGYDFGSGSLLDGNITYVGFKNQYIQLGQFTPSVGFSNWQRPVDVDFLEWPLPVYIFSPGWPQGAHYNIHGDYLVGDVSVFSGSTLEHYSAANPFGATGHIFFSPIHETTKALHIGVSNWYQQPNNTHEVFFGTTPEATSHNWDMLVGTDFIGDVSYFDIVNSELAGVYGPWSFQTEYYLNNVRRYSPEDNLQFSGYYATIGYFLTGESMTYDYPFGIFTTPSSFNHKYGDLQLLVRYSSLNLNDKEILGGKEHNITLGLNWFVNPFVTFKFNVIRAMAHPAFNGDNVDAMIYALRAQIQF